MRRQTLRVVRRLACAGAFLVLATSSADAACIMSPELQLQVNDPAFAAVKISVLVRMLVMSGDPAKADVAGLAAQATSTAERRRLVHNALRTESDTVQTRMQCGGISIRTQLANAVAANEAADVVPLWLDDALTAKAIPSVISAVCNRGDVNEIMLNGTTTATLVTPADTTTAWNVHRIDADTVWSAYRGAGAIVGVIDTGANADHADLKSACSVGGQTCIGAGMVAACEQAGLVERERDQRDGRAFVVHLSARGRRFQTVAERVLGQLDRDLRDALGPRNHEALRAALKGVMTL